MAECKTEEYEEYMRRQKEKEKPKKDENKELLDLVWDIDEKGENLTPWEVNFIGDLVDTSDLLM
jgi:hypothetical protein